MVENSVTLSYTKLDTATDQTMGISQMLGCMEERLRLLEEDAEVGLFEQ